MRVLIVARWKEGRYAPFVTEQVDALKAQGVDCTFFPVSQKGIWGYIRHVPKLRQAIRAQKPDLIHAHYGLCGLMANLQRRIPVVTTYHGSDINDPKVRLLSNISILLSAFNVFVSPETFEMAHPGKNSALIPCGVNLSDYPFIEKAEARERMGWNQHTKYILFAGAFDNPIKNASLAKQAVKQLGSADLIELKGFSRQQVSCLMQAVDALLMTSHTEGSPQVIKEALACGCPVVSVDVGDVRELTLGVEGCYIVGRDPEAIAQGIQQAFQFGRRTDGMSVILQKGLTNDRITQRLIHIYQEIQRCRFSREQL